MNIRTLVVLCVFLSFTSFVVPVVAADTSLSADDEAFLSDIINTGIPMLYQTPEAMNIGVLYGRDSAISDIAIKKTEALIAFTEKISAYSLGPETAILRGSWTSAAEALKEDLKEYGTLVPGCGSCVASMNAMYPEQMKSVTKVQEDLIAYYEKNQVSP